MQSAVLLKQCYKSDTLCHSLRTDVASDSTDHRSSTGAACTRFCLLMFMYLRIVKLLCRFHFPISITLFVFFPAFCRFFCNHFLPHSFSISFVFLFLLCLFFPFRCISLDFGVAASSVSVGHALYSLVELAAFWRNVLPPSSR
jgi:hypothetical protein